MKTHKIAITTLAVLALAIAAYASPIFGTWKGELNGHEITVSVNYINKQADVAMMSDARKVAVTNAAFPKGGPPVLLRFQSLNQQGNFKVVSTAGTDLSYELESTDGREATLRVIDQGKVVATVKLTKTSPVQ